MCKCYLLFIFKSTGKNKTGNNVATLFSRRARALCRGTQSKNPCNLVLDQASNRDFVHKKYNSTRLPMMAAFVGTLRLSWGAWLKTSEPTEREENSKITITQQFTTKWLLFRSNHGSRILFCLANVFRAFAKIVGVEDNTTSEKQDEANSTKKNCFSSGIRSA